MVSRAISSKKKGEEVLEGRKKGGKSVDKHVGQSEKRGQRRSKYIEGPVVSRAIFEGHLQLLQAECRLHTYYGYTYYGYTYYGGPPAAAPGRVPPS